ncbi:hypothetical protein [Streptomyces chartreusis]
MATSQIVLETWSRGLTRDAVGGSQTAEDICYADMRLTVTIEAA